MTSTNTIGAIFNTEFVQYDCDFYLVLASKSKRRLIFVAVCSKRKSDPLSVQFSRMMRDSERVWLVKRIWADWSYPSKYTIICRNYFNDDFYKARLSNMKDFGIPVNKSLIKRSIYPKRKTDQLIDALRHSQLHENQPE